MTSRARTPQSYTQSGTDLKASQELRMKYYAWCGARSLGKLLRSVGWKGTKRPLWLSDGNIPWIWRETLARQMKEDPPSDVSLFKTSHLKEKAKNEGATKA